MILVFLGPIVRFFTKNFVLLSFFIVRHASAELSNLGSKLVPSHLAFWVLGFPVMRHQAEKFHIIMQYYFLTTLPSIF